MKSKLLSLKYLPLYICIGLLLVALVFRSSSVGKQNAQLAVQEDSIADLENKIEAQKTYNVSDNAQTVLQATGLDLNRVVADDRAAEDFFKFIFTWDTLAQYNGIRDELEDTFGLKTDDPFIKTFLPSIAQYDSTGVRYGAGNIEGFNLAYEDMDSNVIDINVKTNKDGSVNTTYTYFTIVDVSSVNQDGEEGVGELAVIYSMDDEHNISNIRGYTVG